MPTYALLFHDDDEMDKASMTDAKWSELFDKFVAWADDLHQRGKLRGVERLLEAGASKSMRRRGGRIVVDGPFVEGKEAVLGFFLVEAADLDGALELAGESPTLAIGGAVEVREVGDFPKPGAPR